MAVIQLKVRPPELPNPPPLSVRFTDLYIKNLNTNERRDYWDTTTFGIPGVLGIRVGKRSKTWCIRYRINNKQRRYTLGRYPDMSLADARLDAQRKLSEVYSGIDIASTPARSRKASTFGNLWVEYNKLIDRTDKVKSKSGKRPRSQKSRRQEELRYLSKFQHLESVPVGDINRRMIAELLETIADRAPIEANRAHGQLHLMFNRALDLGWIDVHPMYKMRKPGGPEIPRSRILTESEIRFIWNFKGTLPKVHEIAKIHQAQVVANKIRAKQAQTILRLLLLTAQRSSEVFGMRYEDINWKALTWTQSTNKTDRPNVLPLSDLAVEVLKAHIQRTTAGIPQTGYVFPSFAKPDRCITTIRKFVERIREAMEVESRDWRVHDIRRTTRTLMSKLNTPSHIAELVLNHAVQGIQRVYDQWDYLDEKREALHKVSEEVRRVLKDKNP